MFNYKTYVSNVNYTFFLSLKRDRFAALQFHSKRRIFNRTLFWCWLHKFLEWMNPTTCVPFSHKCETAVITITTKLTNKNRLKIVNVNFVTRWPLYGVQKSVSAALNEQEQRQIKWINKIKMAFVKMEISYFVVCAFVFFVFTKISHSAFASAFVRLNKSKRK